MDKFGNRAREGILLASRESSVRLSYVRVEHEGEIKLDELDDMTTTWGTWAVMNKKKT